MLIYCDGIAKKKEDEVKVFSALTASGMYDPKVLFPEVFTPVGSKDSPIPSGDDDADDESVDDSNTQFDYSGVKWELPSDGDKAVMAQLAQVMSGNRGVSVVGDDDDGDPGFPLDFTPDDREWV